MNLTHWVPSDGSRPPWPCVESWQNMILPDGMTKTFVRGLPGSIETVWNDVTKKFLDSGSDWLFSTHHDVTFAPETLIRLLSWDKPLISALIFHRHSPVLPHVWNSYEGREEYYTQRINDTRKWLYDHKDWIRFGPYVMDERPDDALTPINFTSTSCTLIHRSVFEKSKDLTRGVWWKCDSELGGGGEDRRFFEYAKASGFDAFVDRSCVAGHIAGDIPTSAADFIAWDSVSDFKETGEPQLEAPKGDGGQ